VSASDNKGGGGAAALLLIIAGIFFLPTPKPMGKVKAKSPAHQQSSIITNAKNKIAKYYDAKIKEANRDIEYAKFQTLRKVGIRPKPSRAILEKEAEVAASRHGIDHRIFKALIKAESSWNPKARSKAGAISLGQIMPANAKRCGLKSAKELWDPVKNLHCGAQILKEEIRTYKGDLNRALQSYNGGPLCIDRCQESINHARIVLAYSSKMTG
jgi:soluble lytic murein transglycosylase-like protein